MPTERFQFTSGQGHQLAAALELPEGTALAQKGWHFRKMPKYSMKGVADIILVHTGRPCFLEVKRLNTRQPAK